MVKQRKDIGGKSFSFRGWAYTRKRADIVADGYRKDGYLVRIAISKTKTGERRYNIYVRRKK